MKRKKWLLLTGAGLVSIVLLACPAMAAEDPSVDISITEGISAPSDSVYQLPLLAPGQIPKATRSRIP